MDKKELDFILKEGEGQFIEFKEGFISDSIGKEICAFANAVGGKILMGVTDYGEIKGIKISNFQKSQLQQIARNMDPSFSISIEVVDKLVVINIPEGTKKPYSINGKYFLRVGTNSQQLKRDELREFFKEEGLISFDEKINKKFVFEKDFDDKEYKEFLRLANITNNLDKKFLLRNIHLMEGDYLTNAGVLLFSKDVKEYFMQAEVMCVLFEGASRVNIIDQKRFSKSLINNFEEAFKFIVSKLNTRYVINEKREEVLELPKEVIREALMNAIVHRDYFSKGHIQVNIFLDRIEISSPGGLVKGLKQEELGNVSLPRNKLLFGTMARTPNVEEAGTGITRIRKAMKERGLKVEFKNTGFFTVTLEREKINVPAKNQPKTSQKPAKKQRKDMIIKAMKEDRFTKRAFAEELEVNKSTIEEDLTELKNEGKIKFVGSRKGGRWEVKNE
jgi:ATP-dependent DNA helicase RecG